MYYEINVAFKGMHYFATAERSITTQKDAEHMYRHFIKLFPEEQGYELSLTRWEERGQRIDVSTSADKPIVFQEV